MLAPQTVFLLPVAPVPRSSLFQGVSSQSGQRATKGSTSFGLAVAFAAYAARPNQRSRKVLRCAEDLDQDHLLMQAGLRNLLGVEENRMAQRLEEECTVSSDLKRCLGDIEVKHKVAVEEVASLTAKLKEAEVEIASLRDEAEKSRAEAKDAKAAAEKAQATNAEQWAAQKRVEHERDEAVLALKNAQTEAAAAEIKAENVVKGAKAEADKAKAELKEALAKVKAK
mmetsp:Transcript_90113/g.160488  ORF Transcript_90113/g.160488 Transcript_90113/m.160488 type:complete len:226 (+) Transcript_90113:55-732(+)|eukprot:CAMPEP_0197664798 /NCGR_PEP_ID=MMETSP1338-20131121/58855_1 /TAXON_ID=43686 ORGANISM="Pelagodinium beii, Strain RCC1491" /NCGR_SAMPLE_ID=MMETSP1338 /ASSEMBLY_ACC=CAM_ASM_000754 /LENGTH=225 /DNA_ID=CAMNT_0043243511 /DNA_START=53 /DNA_END=730 /DNA_ORIENTATION=-